MLVQFSLNSGEARALLAAGFWRWQAVKDARQVIVCRSATCASLMVAKWPDFPWESFAAGVTRKQGVCVNRKPAAEALVTGERWTHKAFDVATLNNDDLIVKSANAYDGQECGTMLGHKQGFGTMGRIFPGLNQTGEPTGCTARVVAPMLTEKLAPQGTLKPSGYPDSSLGWASRFLVWKPHLIFDERDAIRVLTGGDTAIVGRGASVDGYSVTTYHVTVDEARAPALFALVDSVKGAEPLPFAETDCPADCTNCSWGGSAKWAKP